jgi:hypothetical protein
VDQFFIHRPKKYIYRGKNALDIHATRTTFDLFGMSGKA